MRSKYDRTQDDLMAHLSQNFNMRIVPLPVAETGDTG